MQPIKTPSTTLIQYVISIGSVLAAVTHLLFPELAIDAVTVTLLVVAVLPWLGHIFKSIEVPGLGRVEYHELERVESQAEQVGLLASEREGQKYSFELVADSDPNLAMAGLRIEIERLLRTIAEAHRLPKIQIPLKRLVYTLRDHQVLTYEEASSLERIIYLLNSALHGAQVPPEAAKWVLDVGPRLLAALKTKQASL